MAKAKWDNDEWNLVFEGKKINIIIIKRIWGLSNVSYQITIH
jgi:hypothetical protein